MCVGFFKFLSRVTDDPGLADDVDFDFTGEAELGFDGGGDSAG